MKNRIVSLLAMFCVLALIGCDNTPEPQVTESDTPSNTETQTDVPSNTETQIEVSSDTDLDSTPDNETHATPEPQVTESDTPLSTETQTDVPSNTDSVFEPQATESDTPLSTETQTDAIATETTDSSAGQQVAAPADFAIHFETWIDGNQRNILDTYEGYVQKDLIMDGISKQVYTPSYAELCQLYQFVLVLESRGELDFSKPVTYDNYADEELSLSMNPLVCYYLKFTANGKTIEISGDATAGECADQSQEALYFIQAIRDIGNFYRNTEVYKSMPKANGGYD